MPGGLVDQQGRVPSGGDLGRDRRQMPAHRLGVAPWQDQAGALAALGTDGAEDVGGRGALILRCRRPAAAPGPAPGDLVLLADPGSSANQTSMASTATPSRRAIASRRDGRLF
jgi:hypothetical protein